jgi:hypothetical protein
MKTHLVSDKGANVRAACSPKITDKSVLVETVGAVTCFHCKHFLRRLYGVLERNRIPTKDTP